MTKPYVDENGKLHYTAFVKIGEMCYNRECLSRNDPEQLYNHLKNNGINPEDFGVYHPIFEQYKDYSRNDLIEELSKAREELEAIYRMGVI